MNQIFTGTGVALVTPFHKHGTIDFNALKSLLDHVTKGKVDFLVVMGTTGESVTLSKDEKRALVDFVIEENENRLPLMLGVGGNNTQEIENVLRSFDLNGISGILSVSPYYNKPQQKGIYQHFKTIATASPLPIMLYNVPGRTNSNMSAATTLQLANDFRNIIGIKEASGNLVQVMEILRDRPKNFLVISGDDVLTLPMIAMGADGVISVVANSHPAAFSKMVKLGREGKMEEAKKIHYRLMEYIDLLFQDGSPSGIKAALEIMGICENNLRLPLVKVNKALNNQLRQVIEAMNETNP